MKTAELLSKTDCTSWSRIALVWRFYLPCFSWQLWTYPLLAVVVAALTIVLAPGRHMILISMLSMLLNVAMLFGSLTFCRYRGREVETMLPALGLEKCVVILGWCLLGVPLLIRLPHDLVFLIFEGMTNFDFLRLYVLQPMSSEIISQSMWQIVGIGVFASFAMLISCVWGVFRANKHRALHGLLAVVIFYVGIIVLSMVVSFGIGVYYGVQAGLSDTEITLEPMQVAVNVVNGMCYVFAPVCAIYIIFAFIKCCKAIARHQF